MKKFAIPVGNPIYFEGYILKTQADKPFGIFEVDVEAPTNIKIPLLKLVLKWKTEPLELLHQSVTERAIIFQMSYIMLLNMAIKLRLREVTYLKEVTYLRSMLGYAGKLEEMEECYAAG